MLGNGKMIPTNLVWRISEQWIQSYEEKSPFDSLKELRVIKLLQKPRKDLSYYVDNVKECN